MFGNDVNVDGIISIRMPLTSLWVCVCVRARARVCVCARACVQISIRNDKLDEHVANMHTVCERKNLCV